MTGVISEAHRVSNKNATAHVGVFLFFILIFLSPLVGSLGRSFEWVPIYFYLVLGSMAVIASFPLKRADYLVILISASIAIIFLALGYWEKSVLAALIFYAAYSGTRRYPAIIVGAFFVLLIVNYLIVLLQLAGCESAVYAFIDYANESLPVSACVSASVAPQFLPQVRPSGIFPATTYMSIFSIALYAVATFFYKKTSKMFLVMTGSLFMLSGSTMGLALMLLFAVNVFRLKFVSWVFFGYLFTAFAYYSLLPEIFLYNYNVSDFRNSVLNRVMDESILTTNPAVFAITSLLFVAIVAHFTSRFADKLLDVIPIAIVMFGSVLLHDVSSSLIYLFMVGLGFGMFGHLLKKPINGLGDLTGYFRTKLIWR